MVWFSNGQLALPMNCGLETGWVFGMVKNKMTNFTI
jgi:hypothetical protein